MAESKDGVTLEDPEKRLKVELVEVDASAGMDAAISGAWSRRSPGFKRQVLASSDSPGREGWALSAGTLVVSVLILLRVPFLGIRLGAPGAVPGAGTALTTLVQLAVVGLGLALGAGRLGGSSPPA